MIFSIILFYQLIIWRISLSCFNSCGSESFFILRARTPVLSTCLTVQGIRYMQQCRVGMEYILISVAVLREAAENAAQKGNIFFCGSQSHSFTLGAS